MRYRIAISGFIHSSVRPSLAYDVKKAFSSDRKQRETYGRIDGRTRPLIEMRSRIILRDASSYPSVLDWVKRAVEKGRNIQEGGFSGGNRVAENRRSVMFWEERTKKLQAISSTLKIITRRSQDK